MNAFQIGLGMSVASVDVLHTQGNLQMTGRKQRTWPSKATVTLSWVEVPRDSTTRAGMFTPGTRRPPGLPQQRVVAYGLMADVKDGSDTNQPLAGITYRSGNYRAVRHAEPGPSHPTWTPRSTAA